jgi:hypothetical protein
VEVTDVTRKWLHQISRFWRDVILLLIGQLPMTVAADDDDVLMVLLTCWMVKFEAERVRLAAADTHGDSST